MIIKNVKLKNFRSHDFFELNCWKETTMISGENGSGKTSILEAIYEAMQGKSFRAVDREILKRGEKFYRVELEYVTGEKVVLSYDGESEKKTFVAGGKKTARLAKKNKYPVIFFGPEDLNLVASSPSKKRDYFDRFLVQMEPMYSGMISRYSKALRQRNELLKQENTTKDMLFSWNVLLAKYGAEIWKRRESGVEKVNRKITEMYRSIAENNDIVELKLIKDGGDGQNESNYLRRLEENFLKDKILGHTSFGVHRDDYEFVFNGSGAEGSASRGEVRSMVIALKFIEAKILEETLGKKPVVLLDDVFSELDEMRQKALVKNFKENQVIITSVNAVEDVV